MKRDKEAEFLFHQGTNFNSYEYLGVSLERSKDKYEYSFRVWAPLASEVRLISDFVGWERGIKLERTTDAGLWQCDIVNEESLEGSAYKFLVISENGTRHKGDPFARLSRGGADGASVIYLEDDFRFDDSSWLMHRKRTVREEKGSYIAEPINIYEMHLGSFLRHDDGSYYSYAELSELLPSYLKKMGYTHLEVLPLTEYPFDGSWGYQVGGYFAPTSRFGTPRELKELINALHRAGIGVIMDFVPAHFPKDEWGLYEFDGHPLYEYQGHDRQESRSWGTRFFDVGREEVQSFLISSAMYFIKEFHIDGLRVDAVASMLYLDYDREPGEWIPNEEGTNENKEAFAFLQKLNSAIFKEFPDVLMIAEESTAFSGVTAPVSLGGLGFNLKWNMGFANDFFDYLKTDPLYRSEKHSALTFPLMYAHSENYCLPISHDEVVHGKFSMIGKIFGSYEDKFRTYRAALLLLMSYPGKKLLFMGCEFAQFREWDFASSLEWFMLDYETHYGFREYTRALNHFYLSNSPMYELDFSSSGFAWISCDENEKCSIAFRRYSLEGEGLTFVFNFSGISQTLSLYIPDDEEVGVIFKSTPGDEIAVFYEKSENGKIARLTIPPLFGAVIKEGVNKITI